MLGIRQTSGESVALVQPWQTLSAESVPALPIGGEVLAWQDDVWMQRLRRELSFSHLLELSRASDSVARAFYEVQALANRWIVNERFGTDFNQADQLFFDQIVEAAMTDNGLQQAAEVNPGDKFELVFKNLLERLFVERMDQNEEIFVRFMNDAPFQQIVTAWMASETYRRLRSHPGAAERDITPPGSALTGADEGQLRVIAEVLEVLGA